MKLSDRFNPVGRTEMPHCLLCRLTCIGMGSFLCGECLLSMYVPLCEKHAKDSDPVIVFKLAHPRCAKAVA